MRSIPTHDPQTGELNPYYEELTGEKNPLLHEEEIEYDNLSELINHFGDGTGYNEVIDSWDVPQFLRWLKLYNYKIIKNDRKISNKKVD